MGTSIYAMLIATIIPMIIGAIWYNPKVMGGVWMKASGMTDEKVQSGNMALIFGLSFVLSFLLAVMMTRVVIHQVHLPSLLMNEVGFDQAGSEVTNWLNDFNNRYGTHHRSFGHGVVHGGLASLFFVLPILGIISLFERKSYKYVLVHLGYWFITLALMGGVISAWP